MNDAARKHEERVLTSLLLVALVIAGVVLMREGPQFDNVIDGWRFFTIAFFAGALAGFLLWTHFLGATPTLSFSGPNRNPWLAAVALGLASAAAVSYVNRTFASPTGRAISAEIDSVAQARGDRWHVAVKMPDGNYQRYVVSPEVAATLKNQNAVRLSIARGALGYDFVAGFEPVKQ